MQAKEILVSELDCRLPRQTPQLSRGSMITVLGPALYCFIVYSHSDVLKGNYAKRVEGASEKPWSETQGLQQPESVKVADCCGLRASI